MAKKKAPKAALKAVKSKKVTPKKATAPKSPKAIPLNLYSLAVVGGTGSGLYLFGAKVTIEANPALAGQVFDQWSGPVADPAAAKTTVTMPNSDLTVTATYKPVPVVTATPIKPAATPAPAPQPKPIAQPRPSMLPLVIAALGVLGFIIGVGLFLVSRSQGPSQTQIAQALSLTQTAAPQPTATVRVVQPTATKVAPTATVRVAPTATKVAPTATLAPTQALAVTSTSVANLAPEAAVPQSFCDNKDAINVTDQNRWPSADPCNGRAGQYVVVENTCQSGPGVYETEKKVFPSYTIATTRCSTGVMWFEPSVAQAQPTVVMMVVTDPTSITLGTCTTQATRETRLDCATQYYFDYGEKLAGIEAYMRSLGAIWDKIQVGDPFQPDADALASGSPRIWGTLLKATNLRVTGNSCLVTDVPSRIAEYKWIFNDTRYNPRPSVGHYGEAATAGQLTEIAFHGDCSDWPEIRTAAQAAGFPLK